MVLAAAAAPAANHAHPAPVVRAPGYAPLAFEAPVPGTYLLPGLGSAADGAILDSDGTRLSLHDLFGDRVVVLSFIYTGCSDVNGCPLATHVLAEIQKRLITAAPELADKVRLVSLSFDPANDSPEVMAAYGARFRTPAVDWRFVTTAGEAELEPLLDGYDQSIVRDYDADGHYLGSISHMLRVFLIDRTGTIRNIYSVSFLHADTVLADVQTLLAEAPTS